MKKIFATLGLTGSLLLSSCNDNTAIKKHTIANNSSQDIARVLNNDVKNSINLPDHFTIEEDVFAWWTDFEIPWTGKVVERTLNLNTTFELQDTNGNVIANAKKELFSLWVVINIEDNKWHKLWSIEEEIIESLFNIKTVYSIKDGIGNTIWTSEKLAFIGTDIDIYDNQGKEIVTCTRGPLNLLSDTWDVDIKDNKIDKRIIAFIPCYKTHADNQRKKK